MRLPLMSIALLSAATLAYEVLLMRLLSIVQWHHFAYMVISLALLGYGASGTFLALTQRWLQPRYPAAFCICIGLFAGSTLACYLIVEQIPFNPETVLWDARQPFYLMGMYLMLAVPFFFAACAIGLSFIKFHTQITRTYGADMMGAGLGSLGVIVLLMWSFPLPALGWIAAVGALSLLIAVLELKLAHRRYWSLAAIVLAIGFVQLSQQLTPEISPYKALRQTLNISGTQIVSESSSPLGMLSVVESKQLPLRHAPGLSLMAKHEPPEQLAVFTDAAGMSVINHGHAAAERYDYLDQLSWALPYHLTKPASVVILGAGGGSDVLQARLQNVPEIHAVELNPQMLELMHGPYAAYSANLYTQPSVNVHIAEARGFIASGKRDYDLIQIPLLNSFAASAAGLYALNESYLYTVEALRGYLDHLNPNGYLVISRWISLPPRDTLRLLATSITALEQMGVADPGRQLLLIRGWQTSSLLIKNGDINSAEIDALKRFANKRSFDLAWYPGIQAEETNRYNRLAQAHFYHAAKALLSPERNKFIDDYKFNIAPTTDDSPYFFNFFKWRSLPELLALSDRGGMPMLEWGYLVLVATLAQALFASILLIVLPLISLRRQTSLKVHNRKAAVFVYFGALGLAFLFIEIAFIQRFILFLQHPLYAVSIVLTAFLIFAGLGSLYARRRAARQQHPRATWQAVLGIAAISLIYLAALGPLFELLIAWPIWAKIITTLILIMPLAFCMGQPFPLALDGLATTAPALIPWAWAINGCASVISAVLATLLAIQFGFSMVIITAQVLYLLSALILPRLIVGGDERNLGPVNTNY